MCLSSRIRLSVLEQTMASKEEKNSNKGSGSNSGEKDEERAKVSQTSLVLWHARQNDVVALNRLLEQDPSLVHAKDYDSRTALHVAALSGCTGAVKCLMKHGANVNAQDRWENSVGDFTRSKLINVKHAHDIYRMTGEIGSYHYMAPEVFEHRRYDTKVDVFSFAIILYEMFEGSPPFANCDAYEVAKIMSRGEKPIFHAKTYLQKLKELIEECWDHDSSKRPPFLDVLKRLEKIKETLPPEHHWHFLHHN